MYVTQFRPFDVGQAHTDTQHNRTDVLVLDKRTR
jgi:hypothetical protein